MDYRSTQGMDARLARQFEKTFHVPLSDYWQGIIKSSDGQSMKDAVRQTYGQNAVVLVQRLLKIQN